MVDVGLLGGGVGFMEGEDGFLGTRICLSNSAPSSVIIVCFVQTKIRRVELSQTSKQIFRRPTKPRPAILTIINPQPTTILTIA